MYPLETANVMFLSFIRFELLSFEHGNPYHTKCEIYFCACALLLGYNQVFFHPEVLDFHHIYFPQFCPYLESLTCFHGKDLIFHSLYEHLKDRKAAHVHTI